MFGVSKMPRKHLENPRNRVFGVGIQTGTIIVQAALVESKRIWPRVPDCRPSERSYEPISSKGSIRNTV